MRNPGFSRCAACRLRSEESGADQRQQRQTQLADHERVAQVQAQRPAAAVRRRLGLALDGRHQIEARALNGRNESEQEPCEHGEGHGEPQHARLEAQIEEVGAHAGGTERPQQVTAPVRQQDAGESAEQRQHAALRQQLADEPPPGSAERESHGNFLASRHRAREQQARDVAARDEQHESSGCEQQAARAQQVVAPSDAERGFRQREELHAAPFVFRGVPFLQSLRHGLHGLLDAVQRNVRPQAADHLEGQRVARAIESPRRLAGHQLFVHGKRNPEVDDAQRLQAPERGRHDADYGELEAVEGHRPADHFHVGREGSLPQAITDHRYRRRAEGLIFIGGERSSMRGAHTQDVEVVAGDELAADAHGLGSAGHVGTNPLIGCQAGELGNVVAKVAIVRQRHRLIGGGLGHHGEDLRQSRRIAHRQWAEEHRVDQREDGGIGADTERQRDHDDSREGGVPRRRADRESNVSDHGDFLLASTFAWIFRRSQSANDIPLHLARTRRKMCSVGGWKRRLVGD